MKSLIMFAFVLASLCSAVCAQNGTIHSTITATITKTIYLTETVVAGLMTALPSELLTALPGIAPHGAVFDADHSAGGDNNVSVELKSIYIKTAELTSTVYSTKIDGVIVTSMSTFTAIATSTSTDVEEVTSTSTMQVGTTITTTSVAVPASISTATTSTTHIPIAQDITQMFGFSGGEHVKAGPWLVFSVGLLCVAHYLFFAHH